MRFNFLFRKQMYVFQPKKSKNVVMHLQYFISSQHSFPLDFSLSVARLLFLLISVS